MSNYPPGASRELDRRAAEEEAWEAYVEQFFDRAVRELGEEIADCVDDLPELRLSDVDRKDFIRHITAWGRWPVEGVLNAAATTHTIPSFDDWANPEPDPDRKRDEREDR